MNLKFIKNMYLNFLILLIIFYPLQIINASSYDWVEVPKTQFGKQLWDQKNLEINKDGSIRVFSKFIPKSNSQITQDILYTMDINCSEKSFKDVAVGSKEFNEFQNNDSKWKDPDEDKLILGVIDQVCTFRKSELSSLPRKITENGYAKMQVQ